MPDSRHTLKFPAHLAEKPVDALSHVVPEKEILAMQVSLMLAIYSRADEARAQGRNDAVADGFLRLFVNIIDTLEANGPDDAQHCMDKLKTIISAIYT